MTTSLHEQGVASERARVLMTLSHTAAFEHFDTARQLVACGVPARAAQLALDRVKPDVYPEREAGIQDERVRILAILDRPGAADDLAGTRRMIEAER